ncbi:class III signal peptide-containing protein [Thermococcus sp. M36]|uniref:class III signal peptide n=1 Tax=Thermococcus sp. M36 TaxID=1638261 RepID=UPI001438927D|nr:class III signal peptide [Thermococcus sp. M36]NJE06000.1 class III signal peptide-containing protein [Thermococcus sp. M36]
MRTAQAAVEYLFMLVAVMVIVLVVIRYLRESLGTASRQMDEVSDEILRNFANLTGG